MRIEVVHSFAEIPAADWDALVDPEDPFLEHAFLLALEESRSVTPQTGWLTCPVIVRRGRELVGAIPLYLKAHSLGEFVFDWTWARAAEQAGIPYYPKLVAAVPFTPVPGRRLLVRPGEPEAEVLHALAQGLRRAADLLGAHSIHVLFQSAAEQRHLATVHGYLPRRTHQFLWENRGYESFEGFLAAFRAPARKAARKERRAAAGSGLVLRARRGPELGDAEWSALYAFYESTFERHGHAPYLTPLFFERVRATLAERVVAPFAYDGDEPVAGAFCLQRGQSLYGRYWGASRHEPFLHFELCYYLPIEECIARGWQRYDAGAQGIHKLKRGLLPRPIYSAHWLPHPGLAEAVARYLAREDALVAEELEELARQGPYRRDHPESAGEGREEPDPER
ncbi:MAG: GNAT family N-acetyltransferase [Deltaproteobacteria bacterium]|nr:GNAT family N-acetyltransferase [Deltaproteobacteria bacterium]